MNFTLLSETNHPVYISADGRRVRKRFNDPVLAHREHAAFTALGFSCQIGDGWIEIPYLGRPLKPGDITRRVAQHVVTQLFDPRLSRIVEVLPPLDARQNMHERLDKALDSVDGPLPSWLVQLDKAARGIDWSALHGTVPCHHDVHAGNLLNLGGRVTVIDWETACLADPSFIIGQWMGLEVRSPELAGDYQLLARAGRARLGDNYRPEVAETAARYKALTSLLFQVRTRGVHSVPRREARAVMRLYGLR